MGKLLNRAKNYDFNKAIVSKEADNVKLNRKKILCDDLNQIIEEEGLVDDEQQHCLEPTHLDENTPLTSELLAQLQVEEISHQITKYVLHIKAMVREC